MRSKIMLDGLGGGKGGKGKEGKGISGGRNPPRPSCAYLAVYVEIHSAHSQRSSSPAATFKGPSRLFQSPRSEFSQKLGVWGAGPPLARFCPMIAEGGRGTAGRGGAEVAPSFPRPQLARTQKSASEVARVT